MTKDETLKGWILLLVLLSGIASSHEIQMGSQAIDIKRQNETGWQHDFLGKVTVRPGLEFGLQGTYLERFDLYDKRAGALINWRPIERWTMEIKYLAGHGNEILPEEEMQISTYFGWGPGVTPFFGYKDARYSITRLHAFNFGMELEKWPGLIVIPQVLYGKSTFSSPADTKDVHGYGLRVVHYREKSYSLFVFGHKGTEASQAVIGASSSMIHTLTGGLGGGRHFCNNFRADLIFDYTDYEEINNQFLTTTLNLTWMFL